MPTSRSPGLLANILRNLQRPSQRIESTATTPRRASTAAILRLKDLPSASTQDTPLSDSQLQELATAKMAFPGGKVDEGESDLDAAIRETLEEVGLDLKAGGRFRHLGSLNDRKVAGPTGRWIMTLSCHVFLQLTPATPPLKLEVREVISYRWTDLSFFRPDRHFKPEEWHGIQYPVVFLTSPTRKKRSAAEVWLRTRSQPIVNLLLGKTVYKGLVLSGGEDKEGREVKGATARSVGHVSVPMLWGLTLWMTADLMDLALLDEGSTPGKGLMEVNMTSFTHVDVGVLYQFYIKLYQSRRGLLANILRNIQRPSQRVASTATTPRRAATAAILRLKDLPATFSPDIALSDSQLEELARETFCMHAVCFDFYKMAFPGGKVEKGESDLEGAIRETLEEIGLDLTAGGRYRHLGSLNDRKVSGPTGRWIMTLSCHVFLQLTPATPSLTLDTREITSCRWTDLSFFRPDREFVRGEWHDIRYPVVFLTAPTRKKRSSLEVWLRTRTQPLFDLVLGKTVYKGLILPGVEEEGRKEAEEAKARSVGHAGLSVAPVPVLWGLTLWMTADLMDLALYDGGSAPGKGSNRTTAANTAMPASDGNQKAPSAGPRPKSFHFGSFSLAALNSATTPNGPATALPARADQNSATTLSHSTEDVLDQPDDGRRGNRGLASWFRRNSVDSPASMPSSPVADADVATADLPPSGQGKEKSAFANWPSWTAGAGYDATRREGSSGSLFGKSLWMSKGAGGTSAVGTGMDSSSLSDGGGDGGVATPAISRPAAGMSVVQSALEETNDGAEKAAMRGLIDDYSEDDVATFTNPMLQLIAAEMKMGFEGENARTDLIPEDALINDNSSIHGLLLYNQNRGEADPIGDYGLQPGDVDEWSLSDEDRGDTPSESLPLEKKLTKRSHGKVAALTVEEKIRIAFELPQVEGYRGGYIYLTENHLCFFASLPSSEQGIVVKSGFLAKRPRAGTILQYVTYWFSLKNDILYFYENSKDLYFPVGGINLKYVTSVERSKTKENGFKIVTPRKKYHLIADTEILLQEWLVRVL
ncbi:Sterol 3-beta-glucosyltransferase [Irineochytrium annulatum]|nr:Sterol 3-beta-glucosyltransferase [Irineochytrium annulatum]